MRKTRIYLTENEFQFIRYLLLKQKEEIIIGDEVNNISFKASVTDYLLANKFNEFKPFVFKK